MKMITKTRMQKGALKSDSVPSTASSAYLISFTRRLQEFLRDEEEGASLVEFALVSTLLLLPLATFIVTFSMYMNNQLQLTNAVDVGARTLAINGGITLDPCSVASTAIINAAPALNPSKMTFSYSLNGNPYSGTTCASANLQTGAALNLAGGTSVKVTATYPCNLSFYGHNFAPINNCIYASTTELVQ